MTYFFLELLIFFDSKKYCLSIQTLWETIMKQKQAFSLVNVDVKLKLLMNRS